VERKKGREKKGALTPSSPYLGERGGAGRGRKIRTSKKGVREKGSQLWPEGTENNQPHTPRKKKKTKKKKKKETPAKTTREARWR